MEEQAKLREKLEKALVALGKARTRLDAVQRQKSEPIAIIGMGCRFPGGAGDPESFWRLLHEGVDAITEVPPDRWDAAALHDADPSVPGKMISRWGGFLAGLDGLDAGYFGLSPREARALDPQHRLLLEVSWEALQRAGQPVDGLTGRAVGVFVGMNTTDYLTAKLRLGDFSKLDFYDATGNTASVAVGRLSYLLGVHGPCVALDTACSSSLVTVHLACQSLRAGECDLALAGGVNVILAPETTVVVSNGRALAPDGRCKTFDASADGYVRGEGCGMLVLKRLSDAVAAGDPILALVRGSAVNHDGRSSGLTVPSGPAQQRLIRAAVEAAGVEPTQVGYVEAHGTGTSVGDPIEVRAVAAALCAGRAKERPLALGSVKTNVGHLEAAAGVAGLIKAILMLQHGIIPPHLHLRKLNPMVEWDSLPIVVPTAPTPWTVPGGKRVTGVSSFGIGGTNAHIILEEPPAPPAAEAEQTPRAHLLSLSGRSPGALREMARAVRDHLAGDGRSARVADVCYTAAVRRAHHEQRLAFVGRSREELLSGLDVFLQNGEARARPRAASRRGPVLVFTGEGGPWSGQGLGLLGSEPEFRASMERCDAAIRKHADWSLLEQLRAGRPASAAVLQPVRFALQVSLAALWRAWGVVPEAVVGVGPGEVAAAHVAGALSLEDAVRVICERGRRLGTGAGAAAMVELPAEELQALIGSRSVLVSAVHGPATTVISGAQEELDRLLRELEGRRVSFQRLEADAALAGAQVDAAAAGLEQVLQGIRPGAATLLLGSSVTGASVDGRGLDAAYWARNLGRPAQLARVLDALCGEGFGTFLEVGPHPVLAGALRQALQREGREGLVLSSLSAGADERGSLLGSLAALYESGHPVNLGGPHPSGRVVPLPLYPWQRERYWGEAQELGQALVGKPRRGRGAPSRRHPLVWLGAALAEQPGASVWEGALERAECRALLHEGDVLSPLALVEAALAVAGEISGGEPHALAELSLVEPIALPAEGSLRVQVGVSPQESGARRFRIHVRPGGTTAPEPAWVLQASGRVVTEGERGAPFLLQEDRPEAVRARCAEEIARTAGEVTRLGGLWRREGEAIAEVGPGEGLLALLEAGSRVLSAAVPGAASRRLPLSVGRVWSDAGGRQPRWIHARLRRSAPGAVEGELRFLDEAGEVVIEVGGLRLSTGGMLVACSRAAASAEAEALASAASVARPAEPAREVPSRSAGASAPAPQTRPPPEPKAGARAQAPSRGGAKERLRAEIRAADPDQQRALLLPLLQEQLARTLGLEDARPDPDLPVMQMGVNSLMISEIRSWLKGTVGVTVPMEVFTADFTLRHVLEEVVRQLRALHTEQADAPPAPPAAAARTEEKRPEPAPTLKPVAAMSTNPWVVYPARAPGARLRLFCFPFAGGAPSVYRTWPAKLPREVEVCAIQLPGREGRFKEKPFTRMNQLVDALVAGIRPELDRPFAFFGHSMGSLVAYEVTRRLRREKAPLPVHLFSSGGRAPHTPDLSRPLHRLPDADFVEGVRRIGGLPDELARNKDVMEIFLPILRADFTVIETYVHVREEPLPIPITVLGGEQDMRVSRAQVEAWVNEGAGPVGVHFFPGGHFFLQTHEAELLQLVSNTLQPYLSGS